MAEDLKEYSDELADEIYSSAGASNPSRADLEDAFFEIATEIAMSEGDIPNADRVIFNEPRRGKIDGYAGELDSGDLFDGVLSVLVTDFVIPGESTNIPTLTATEMDVLFRRARNFVERCFNDDHRTELVNSASAYTLADNIAKKWPVISRLRIILFTNKVLSARIDRRDADELNSVECSYSVWDLERMHSFLLSGKVREDMHINLLEDFGGAIPALPAHSVDSTYQAYLAVIRGDSLARIYSKWGERLLESNVRVFLQFRGKVNRDMRNTIENESEMFFAYNNGLTATAEGVELRAGDTGLEITDIKNFQIVNGAQTAGAIFSISRDKKVDLSEIFIQMKLAVIDVEKSEAVVPRISQYSNSQNVVKAADFFANHPYHVRIEQKSRQIQTPSLDGQFGKNSYWFYERSRGQYENLRSRATTSAQRNSFKEQYPLGMKFSKTDLAKYLNVWQGKPHIVALGAEKNFANFAAYIGSEWDRDTLQFSDMYFRHLIAKMIIFKATEKLVSVQDWYMAGGYRAQIVAYSISKLAHYLSEQGQVMDFDAIWDLQEMPSGVEDALKIISREVDQVIRNPQLTGMNITEWAKKQACWSRVSDLVIDLPESLNSCLISGTKEKENKRAAKKDQKVVDGIQAQSMVYNAGADFWNKVALWGLDRKLLSDGEINSLRRISQGEVVDEKQCIGILNALERLQGEGCQLILENESTVIKIKI